MDLSVSIIKIITIRASESEKRPIVSRGSRAIALFNNTRKFKTQLMITFPQSSIVIMATANETLETETQIDQNIPITTENRLNRLR